MNIISLNSSSTLSLNRAVRRHAGLPTTMLAVLSLQSACGSDSASQAVGDPVVGSGGSGPGSSGDATNRTGGARAVGQAGASSANCDARPAESVTLNQPIWQDGFKVTIGNAVYKAATPSCSPGTLTFDAEFENRGTETSRFDSPTYLSSAGKDYELSSYNRESPDVPGKRKGKGSFFFEVGNTFRLDDATLWFGSAGDHHAKVPLGNNSPDPLVTLEPQTVALNAKLVAGDWTFTFPEALILADSSTSHGTWPDDTLYLHLNYSITTAENVNQSDYASDDAFVLEMPDGTSIAPAGAWSGVINREDITYSDLWVGFMIPSPSSGTYTLEASEVRLDDAKIATVKLPIVLPKFASFGEM